MFARHFSHSKEEVSIVIEGRCPKCGIRYYGWALLNPKHQTCPDCDIMLQIKDSNGTVSEGYSPAVIDKKLFKEIMNIINGKNNNQDRNMKND
jgi:transcription initiation factor IIE alpha subunit